MRAAYCSERRADAGVGTEAQRGFDMLDRNVGLTRPIPECVTEIPASRVVRVERQGTVDQRYHGTDILAEIGQRVGGIRQDAWIVTGHHQGWPGEIYALRTICLRVLAPIVNKQPKTALRSPSERRAIMRIARDRLLHQTQSLGNLL